MTKWGGLRAALLIVAALVALSPSVVFGQTPPTDVNVVNPPDLAPIIASLDSLLDFVVVVGVLACIGAAAGLATVFAVVVSYFK